MPRTKLSVPDVAEAGPALWSNAIRAGDMLFISGQVARPFEGGTEMVGADEYEQSKQIFSRIDRIIRAAGGTMDNLVKMPIYLVDIKNNTEVWRARREFFTGDFPASTLVEVRSLAKPESRKPAAACCSRARPSQSAPQAGAARGRQTARRSAGPPSTRRAAG
jgi:enamine deaminase RidA (YjgF/YER057c/UK114 family)